MVGRALACSWRSGGSADFHKMGAGGDQDPRRLVATTVAHAYAETPDARIEHAQPPARGTDRLMATRDRLTGGELNAALTSALVGIHTEYLGRGPRTASTFHHDNILVTLMHDVLTQAERALVEAHRDDAVTSIRHLFQKTMQADFTAAVERLTGRKVVAFISGNHVEPDIAAEIFILDAPIVSVPAARGSDRS
jgi:uncharacterized protein YbcI